MDILEVLDDGGGRLQHVVVAVLHHVLKIEVLDRNMIGSELEVAAHRLEIRLFQRLADRVLVGQVTLGCDHRRVDQHCRVVGLRSIE
jgi:hypothetical protein